MRRAALGFLIAGAALLVLGIVGAVDRHTGTGLVSDYRRGLLPPFLAFAGVVMMGSAGERLRRREPAPLRQADVPTAPRGYRRDQVDRYIRQLLAELEGPAG
jgi:hypothetical protein